MRVLYAGDVVYFPPKIISGGFLFMRFELKMFIGAVLVAVAIFAYLSTFQVTTTASAAEAAVATATATIAPIDASATVAVVASGVKEVATGAVVDGASATVPAK